MDQPSDTRRAERQGRQAKWSVTLLQDIVLNTELMEYFCNENEKDRSRMRGK
jgi:hypothetical protein